MAYSSAASTSGLTFDSSGGNIGNQQPNYLAWVIGALAVLVLFVWLQTKGRK